MLEKKTKQKKITIHYHFSLKNYHIVRILSTQFQVVLFVTHTHLEIVGTPTNDLFTLMLSFTEREEKLQEEYQVINNLLRNLI